MAYKKTILLPAVKGDELELKIFTDENCLVYEGPFGIGEPIGKAFLKWEDIELMIIPGIAFDKLLNRMGRGKAYYDKLLTQTSAKKVGVCFQFQVIENVPTEAHDIKMDDLLYA
jgi:5-formyltetrahydrofolate cyclo-ligase